MTERKLVGHVVVDSGLMMVGDPCYTMPDDCSSDKKTHDWPTFCAALPDDYPTIAQPFDQENAAVVVSSGFGDGYYPVYVEISDEGEWGKRIKSITVLFIEDEE